MIHSTLLYIDTKSLFGTNNIQGIVKPYNITLTKIEDSGTFVVDESYS